MIDQFWQFAATWAQDNNAVLAALAIAMILAFPFAILRRVAGRRRPVKPQVAFDCAPAGPKTYALRKDRTPEVQEPSPRRPEGVEPWPRADLVTPADSVTLAALPFELRALRGTDLKSVEGFEQDLVNLLQRAPAIDIRPVHYARTAAAGTGMLIPIDARFLLEGSIHTFPAGPRVAVHIIIHIIETATGESIYVETFEGPLRRLAGIMDEVTESIYGALSAMIELPPEPLAHSEPTRSPAALALHNRSARVLDQGLSHQRLDESVRLLDHACRIDPGFVSAKRFLMTAIAVRILTLTSPDRQKDLAAMASLSETLVAMDEPSARLSTCLGLMYLAGRDFVRAKTCFADAMKHEPGAIDAPIYAVWAQLLNDEAVGSIAPVEAHLLQSGSLARNAIAHHVIALHHLQNGEFKSAQEVAETAVAEFKPFHMNWLILALAFALQGDMQQASSTFFRARRIIGAHDEATITAWVEQAAASAKRARRWRKAFDSSWKA